MTGTGKDPTVHEVKHIDWANQSFDGQKADVYINTGQLGGRHFLVRVTRADGKPVLIAVHL